MTCHQQALPAVAFGWARERGLRVDTHELGRQLDAQFERRSIEMERALELNQPTPDAPVALGYDADGLRALRYESDDMMEAMSHYLLGTQRGDGSWPAFVRRPPMEDGPIIGTAWAARAMQLYPPPRRSGQQADKAASLAPPKRCR